MLNVETMAFREARIARARSRSLPSSIDDLPIDPDYLTMMPASAEAEALLNEWRPALYGYSSRFADHSYRKVLSKRRGPTGLQQFAYPLGPNRTLADRTLAPVEQFPKNHSAWANHRVIGISLNNMGHAAVGQLDSADWVRSVGLMPQYSHLHQLLHLFYTLDVKKHPDGTPRKTAQDYSRKGQYASVGRFVQVGLNTASNIFVKNAYLAGDSVDAGSTPYDVALVAYKSAVPSRLASLGIKQLTPALKAVTPGDFSSGSALFEGAYPFDPAPFLYRRQPTGDGTPILDFAIAPLDLIDPGSCKLEHGQYVLDTAGVRQIRDIVEIGPGGVVRETNGCLAMLNDPGSVSALREFQEWISELMISTGVTALRLAERRDSRPQCVPEETVSIGSRMQDGLRREEPGI